MLCDMCGQKEAIITYTEISNEGRTRQHLCEDCAAGLTSFMSFLEGLFRALSQGSQERDKLQGNDNEQLQCPACGMELSEFYKTGRFGCATCYDTFRRHLPKVFRNLQGAQEHIGKRGRHLFREGEREPETEIIVGDDQIKELRLAMAVEREDYKEAARLRDSLKGCCHE